jgi:hypothetical protein
MDHACGVNEFRAVVMSSSAEERGRGWPIHFSLAPAAQQIFEFAGITVVLLRTAARDFHRKQFWALSDRSKYAPSGMRRRVSSLVQAGPPPKFEGSVDAQ